MKHDQKNLNRIKKFDQHIKNQRIKLYKNQKDRKPAYYKNMDIACKEVQKEALKIRQKKMYDQKRKTLPELEINEMCNILLTTHIGMVAVPSKKDDSYDVNLAIYNYDRKIYEFISSNKVNALKSYVIAMNDQSLPHYVLERIEETLLSTTYSSKLAIYSPHQGYEIPVGNGIYNALTDKLEQYTPEITILNRIETDYVRNAKHPKLGGITFEKMMSDLSNHHPDRIELLHQILKSIVTGIQPSASMFIFLGEGGDGKSVFFDLISYMIGIQNVGYVNFEEINDHNAMIKAFDKKLALGTDNDGKMYIKKTSFLKRIASRDVLTLSRKFMSSISVKFQPMMVQLCNELPRFGEMNTAIRRRIVIFRAENSHTNKGTANTDLEEIIKDKRLHEYVLSYILEKIPYFSNYNDLDSNVLVDSLEDEDYVSQFIEDLISSGFINQSNSKIPTNILYAAYRDWHNENIESSKVMSINSFNARIKTKMHQMGFKFNTELKHSRSRLSALESSGQFDSSNLVKSDFSGEALEKALQHKGKQSNYFELVHDLDLSIRTIKRNVHEISVIHYFKLNQKFKVFFDAFDDQFLNNDNPEFIIQAEERTNDQQNSFTKQDLTISNIKQASHEELHELLAVANNIAKYNTEQHHLQTILLEYTTDINTDNESLRDILIDFSEQM